jgi:uncharacterized coiled-coil DUF342 family protein
MSKSKTDKYRDKVDSLESQVSILIKQSKRNNESYNTFAATNLEFRKRINQLEARRWWEFWK